MATPAKKAENPTKDYVVMLRYLLFYLFFFGLLYLVALFGEVAEK
ncbi:hypothetical protein [Mesoterricola silvestris]|uniref:Uncharacterized protein n=1 Tax=Mesoterricola silvestris TaxID=2927979 RepID=A0AA48GKQ0_9BACT|nr:hypothetical protein [Mesoterricola silvestris]BDU74846.1 hypothetical protein METEAL_40200 [Mesoterricola silvestris]